MGNKVRNSIALASAVVVLPNWHLLSAVAGQSASPTVLLRVINAAPVAEEIIQKALQESARIYQAAGVTLLWRAYDAESTDGASITLDVVLLSKVVSEQILVKRRLPSTVLGMAPRDTQRVYIFWDRIRFRALSDGVPMDTVLGRVVAHEVGHHLLPGDAHSAIGIMRVNVSYNPLASPEFTAEQGASIRGRVMRSN